MLMGKTEFKDKIIVYNISRDARKPVFGVSDKV